MIRVIIPIRSLLLSSSVEPPYVIEKARSVIPNKKEDYSKTAER